jgi:drug/metabolite transporter (DMT)-like permease
VAAVTLRAAIGGVVLAPFAIRSMRGRFGALRTARSRILGMAALGVAGTQGFYFAAIERIPVSTAILVEYMAPVALVLTAWVTLRRRPQTVVLVGSVIAVVGLALIVSPAGHHLDPVGLFLALAAMVCCAAYFVLAARPIDGVPPVALAAVSLLVGAVILAAVGALHLAPVAVSTQDVVLLGGQTPWWVPMLVVGLVATALAYATSITAARLLGSRLASFAGLLEVVAAAAYAWVLLGESLSAAQFAGGALIVVGILFVRAERDGQPAPQRDLVPQQTGVG